MSSPENGLDLSGEPARRPQDRLRIGQIGLRRQTDCPGVVQVDPKGESLVPGEGVGIDGLEIRYVLFQLSGLRRRSRETTFGEDV